MKKITKISLITAISMMVIGGALYGIGIAKGGKSAVKLVGNTISDYTGGKVINDSKNLSEFDDIELNAAEAIVEVIPSDKYRIEASFNSNYKINYKVENKKLIISGEGEHTPYKIVGVDMKHAGIQYGRLHPLDIKIYVPKDVKLSKVNMKIKEGNIVISKINCDNISTDIQSGGVELHHMKSKDIIIKNLNGDAFLSNIEADSLNMQNVNGITEFDHIKVNKFNVNSPNASIGSENLNVGEANIACDSINFKKFIANNIDISKIVNSSHIQGKIDGNIKIKSDDTTELRLNLENSMNEYNYKLNTNEKSVSINSKEHGAKFEQDNKASKTMDIDTPNGNIVVKTK